MFFYAYRQRPRLGEVWEFEKLLINIFQKSNSIPNVQLLPSAQISPNLC
jgi:hypothetical protein